MNEYIEIETDCGRIRGNKREKCREFLGIRYARAERFAYSKTVDSWEGIYDATRYGDACVQYRTYFPHLDVPERRFYHREFREGLEFNYSEDCLNLNIYTPLKAQNCSVLVFIHGGGFNSMANSEGYLDGEGYAKRNVILVCINYRVGVFGYMTHEKIEEKYSRDGNFGLDDMLMALKWVKNHIESFGGKPDAITVMGQSAGAISLQYLCLSEHAKGLYKRAIMISGAGLFPKIGRPRHKEETREYWEEVIRLSGAKSLDEFKRLDAKSILSVIESIKVKRKDNTYNTQPVIDGYLLTQEVDKLINHPLDIDYMAGTTSNDMFTVVLYNMARRFINANKGYRYYFDIDAPGDDNGAFHSSDLRYVFGTLSKSFRNYDKRDYEISEMIMDYISGFVKTGNPNHEKQPVWNNNGIPLYISREYVKMKKPALMKMIVNTFRGDPK